MAGTASYSIERGDACSRVRLEINDRDPAAADFSDDEIYAALRETATADFLAISCAEDPDVTEATAEVRVGASAVELVLRRTTDPAEDPDIFPLTTGRDYDKVGDLIAGILDLEKGYAVRLAVSPEGDLLQVDQPPGQAERRARAAYAQQSGLLELTDGEIDITDGAEYRFAIYSIDQAAARLRKLRELDEADERREGNVTIKRRALKDVAAATAMPSAYGIFTRPV